MKMLLALTQKDGFIVHAIKGSQSMALHFPVPSRVMNVLR